MFWLTAVAIALVVPHRLTALFCSRYPANTFTPKSPVDENFVISISGNPQTYILGQEYNISINAFSGLRFINFKLALENDNGDASYNLDLGRFELIDTVETRYSPKCVNMVESTNNNPKTRIDVAWRAPEQPGSGCILIRATLLQHRDVWYMDDGGLTKRICEEASDDVESLTIASSGKPCCACDEARYELNFEGTWSRNHHPKDFPAKGWTARFSDIVGAAHTSDYRFWEYGSLASEGIRELAEHGSTRTLENEFSHNFRSGKIRTIVKARGPAFPNLNGQAVASIRVDPQNHFLSLASKIDPSPDWIVGVSGLELCMKNCTWLEQKVVTLYPWDVGTDAGATYTSADQPQMPPDVIRRMRSDFPNDPRSPFFDETGAPMKPLAVLTIRRQRLYERLCEDDESNNADVPRECFTHPWSAWSQCSAKCGEGRQYRRRVFKQSEVAHIYNCDQLVVNRQDRTCVGEECTEPEYSNKLMQGRFRGKNVELDGAFETGKTKAECQLTAWGPWSDCSKTCGEGSMMRRRQYINPASEEKCQSVRPEQLIEHKSCFGRLCLGEIFDNRRSHKDDGQEQETLSENTPFEKTRLDTGGNGYDVERINENNNEDRSLLERGSYYDKDSRTPLHSVNDYNKKAVEHDNHLNAVKNESFERRSFSNKQNINQFSELDFGSTADMVHLERDNQDYYLNANDNEMVGNFQHQGRDSGGHTSRTEESQVPSYCFEPLKVFTCLDSVVVGNFWFYNYCEDECMLYAADSCDQNDNKFTSLEVCEEQCRHPDNADVLRKMQARDCFKPERLRNQRKKHHRFHKFTSGYA